MRKLDFRERKRYSVIKFRTKWYDRYEKKALETS